MSCVGVTNGLWRCEYQVTSAGPIHLFVPIIDHTRSDPSSKHYGKHMTAEEVIDFFAASNESVDAVIAWVTSSGIDRKRVSLSANKQVSSLDLN